MKDFTDNQLSYLHKPFSRDTPMQLISWAGDKNHPQFSMTLANWVMQEQRRVKMCKWGVTQQTQLPSANAVVTKPYCLTPNSHKSYFCSCFLILLTEVMSLLFCETLQCCDSCPQGFQLPPLTRREMRTPQVRR